jgi:hypothetical protein
VSARRNVNWLAWFGAGCIALITIALAFVYLTFYWSARLLAKSAAHKLTENAATRPALEDEISILTCSGASIAGAPAGVDNYRYRLTLSGRGSSALLVSLMRVSVLDRQGQILATADLRNTIVVPGSPQTVQGTLSLTPGQLEAARGVVAEIVPTHLK